MNNISEIKSSNPDLSVVIPCLNEEDTLASCLNKLQTVASNVDFSVEVIVADNGSNDGSVKIAKSFNARVIHVSRKGYGSALIGGIENANAPFVLMADADDSYDFLETPKFYNKINEGFDLVQGCRLPGGGGEIEKGAMPWSHRYIGNPMFTMLVRRWFGSPVHDVYCGMRVFKKSFYDSLKLKCTGMEFATEMIIKAAQYGAKTGEVPITLHKDGRIQHPPHLRTIRDGWKTLCFFMLFAPARLFLIPGAFLIVLGLLVAYLGFSEANFKTITLGAHTLLGSSLFIITGYQAVLMYLLSLEISAKRGIKRRLKHNRLEKSFTTNSLKISLCFIVAGIFLWIKVFLLWHSGDFGTLDYKETMKFIIPGATLITLSLATLIFNFFAAWIKIEVEP